MDVAIEQPLSLSQHNRLARFTADRSADIHCHCLPGLDDGPGDMEDALSLCQALVDDGITHVIATPHQLGRYEKANRAGQIRLAVCELQEALDAHLIPLRVAPGADVRIDSMLLSWLDAGDLMTLADAGRYLLLEMPDHASFEIAPLLRELCRQNITPIVSHPERYSVVRKQPSIVIRWLDAGAVLQLTAGSLIGAFGHAAERLAWSLLEADLVSLIATDAHHVASRPPVMSAAIDRISNKLSHATARLLCIENPSRIWSGEPLDHLPRGRVSNS